MTNLPKNLRARTRTRKNGQQITYYFLDLGGKPRREISLGTDYVLAVKKWAEHHIYINPKECTFMQLAKRFRAEILPTKKANTARWQNSALNQLEQFFGNPDVAITQIQSQHIRQFLDWKRNAPAHANNAINLFHQMWNYAREWGYTDRVCPSEGIKKHPVSKRQNYVENHIYQLFLQHADEQLRDMMQLAYILGQRPSDIAKIHASHIADGILHIKQQKTGAQIRFKIQGELERILQRRPSEGYLFTNTRQKPINSERIRTYFNQLKTKLSKAYPELKDEIKNFQFRDLRAKSATDIYLSSDITAAQKQLGHTSSRMTETYIRKNKLLTPFDPNDT